MKDGGGATSGGAKKRRILRARLAAYTRILLGNWRALRYLVMRKNGEWAWRIRGKRLSAAIGGNGLRNPRNIGGIWTAWRVRFFYAYSYESLYGTGNAEAFQRKESAMPPANRFWMISKPRIGPDSRIWYDWSLVREVATLAVLIFAPVGIFSYHISEGVTFLRER